MSVSGEDSRSGANHSEHSTVMLALFVGAIVGLNVSSAILLKTLASQVELPVLLIGVGFGIVFMLNGLRLVVWMFANRRFPLSTTYPLTSVFFPVMLGVSFAYNESITFNRIAGTLLITCGVFWLGWRVNRLDSTLSHLESMQSEPVQPTREDF